MSSDESHDNPLVLLTKQHPASSENAGFCIHLHSTHEISDAKSRENLRQLLREQ